MGNGSKKRERFRPNNGGIVLSIEFDKRILNDLRELSEEDGLGSIYQEIRNACYAYVNRRMGRPDNCRSAEGDSSECETFTPGEN